MRVLRSTRRRNSMLNFLIVLFLIGLFCNANPYSVRADTLPNRAPTFSTTHGTATAEDLVAAMDIPAELVISSSLARASSADQPVLNFPLDTTNRTWKLTQGAKTGTHTDTSAYALDFSDTVNENGILKDLTGIEDVPILAAAGGEVVNAVWWKTIKNAPIEDKDPGNYIIIKHGNGFTTSYCHLKYNSIPESLRTPGAKVTSGQFIGIMDETGSADGIHLHFVVKRNNLGAPAESATLDKTMVAGRLITSYEEEQFYPASADFSDKVGAHVFDSSLSNFPISSTTFAVLSSGNAANAAKPNTEGSLSTILSGLNNEQGNDLVQLSVTLKVPPGTQGWAVDWKFLSEEFPEWVGSQYNDVFLIETPLSSFKLSGFATIEAPNNVARDPEGRLVSVNTVGYIGMSAANAIGTTYDGATATLTAGAPIPADRDIITIVFSVMDLGDSVYDTTVFLDNFRFIKPIHVPPLDTTWFSAYVPPGQVQVVFSTSWTGSDIVMTLIDPSGRIIDRNTTAPDIVHDVGPNFEDYTIFNPISGDWQVNLYGADVPPEGEDVEFVLRFSAVPSTNLPPTAEAGPDQTVERTSEAGAQVTLDGSGSYDPDNSPEPLAYTWNWAGGSATGVNPTINMPMGTTVVTLEVSDGALTDTDTVSIAVQDTAPPIATVEFPTANLVVQDGVTLEASASDLSGVAAVYFYVREPDGAQGGIISSEFEDLSATLNSGTGKWEYSFDTLKLPDGNYLVLAKAVDTYNNEGWSAAVPFSIRNWAVITLLPSTQSSKAGRTMPVKFALKIAASVNPAQPFVYNDDLTIKIYATSNPGVILQTSTFGSGSRDYRIDNNTLYITNFPTSKVPMQYTVEIWRTSKNFMVGSFTFKTVK